uniref:Uncharacterized protein n=1 Tax=Zea mays TaxID=4577 RepID=A0A804UCQ1_MAIZE
MILWEPITTKIQNDRTFRRNTTFQMTKRLKAKVRLLTMNRQNSTRTHLLSWSQQQDKVCAKPNLPCPNVYTTATLVRKVPLTTSTNTTKKQSKEMTCSLQAFPRDRR